MIVTNVTTPSFCMNLLRPSHRMPNLYVLHPILENADAYVLKEFGAYSRYVVMFVHASLTLTSR